MLALAMRREHTTGRSNYEPTNPLAGFEHLQHNNGNPFAVVPAAAAAVEGRVRDARPEAAEGELQEFVDIAQVQQLLQQQQQQQQQHQQQQHHHHHHHQQQQQATAAAASCIWGAVYPPPPPALGYHHHHHHHHHVPPPSGNVQVFVTSILNDAKSNGRFKGRFFFREGPRISFSLRGDSKLSSPMFL